MSLMFGASQLAQRAVYWRSEIIHTILTIMKVPNIKQIKLIKHIKLIRHRHTLDIKDITDAYKSEVGLKSQKLNLEIQSHIDVFES